MLDRRGFFVGGTWERPADARDLPVIDPSTENACAVVSIGAPADADRAVDAAKVAFSLWSQTSRQQRLDLLEKLLGQYRLRRGDMAEALMLEMGAPRDHARDAQWEAGEGHLVEAINVLRNFEFERKRGSGRLYLEPVGVAALITPWNWPMNQVILKVAPALAAGCTVVLKPSEIAPLSSMVLTQMIDDAGFPPGVFNLVNGDGAGVGSRLSEHPDVDIVSFTGSTRAGVLISKAAAPTVKRVSLELGGKGANIIFADADKGAVERGVLHCFDNSGQSCDAPTRMLVERGVYNQAVKTAERVARGVKVNSAHLSGSHIGPVVSHQHWQNIQRHIQTGIDAGARLVVGGTGRPEGLNKGYFVKPTVFADVSNDMAIAREEIFGPVVVVIPFDTEAEAIEIANDTPYGLGNYVQTTNTERAARVAKSLRSGMVQVNGNALDYDMPFGGYKQSGNGREGSVWGLQEYLEVKAVSGLEG